MKKFVEAEVEITLITSVEDIMRASVDIEPGDGWSDGVEEDGTN